MSDAVSPVARPPMVGVYRFWRDSGYALGALIAGATADALGYGGAIAIVAALTAASGLWVLGDMPGRQPRHRGATEPGEQPAGQIMSPPVPGSKTISSLAGRQTFSSSSSGEVGMPDSPAQ